LSIVLFKNQMMQIINKKIIILLIGIAMVVAGLFFVNLLANNNVEATWEECMDACDTGETPIDVCVTCPDNSQICTGSLQGGVQGAC